MLGLLAALAVTLSPRALTAEDEPARSPRNANYTLQATLDPVNHLVLGTGELSWRNISTVPATELRFHMYWNAWRDDNSSWMREQLLGRTQPLPHRPDEDRGSTDLTMLRIAGPNGADLLPRAHYIAPDDHNGDDRTVLSVPLDHPVAPGDTIALDYSWNAHVPRAYARTGVIGNFFFLGQWFPKIGVLEDTGWNCHQFHASTEFFADFGTYDVNLTVPSRWIVGATGEEAAPVDHGDGTTTHHFVERDVHDFAWTTSPDFLDLHQRVDVPGLPPVDVRLLLQPEHPDQIDRHFRAARAALEDYGRWFGPYPYGHLTIVDPVAIVNPAAQGGSVSGMEYPTLIVAGTRWIDPWKGADPEEVVIHETGHQLWYGIVATNEFEHAWMDEGLTTYATARVIADQYPNRFATVERYFGGLVPWTYDDVPWSLIDDGDRRNVYRDAPAWDVPATPSWQYWPMAARSTTYAKTALWLTSLERIVGWETMQRILAAYFAKSAFRHPGPSDFFATATAVSGQDLTWFVHAVYESATTFDYAVGPVSSQLTATGSFDNVIVVRRLGDGIFPVNVRVTFDDGAVVTEPWAGDDRWHALRYRRGAPVARVEIDPDRILTLDVNYTNNSWTAHPQAKAAADKWALQWFTWFEQLLMTYAFFS